LQETNGLVHRGSHPGSGSTFTLAPGVQLEPLGDGSAVLYSKELDRSLSLNHTAALLCSFADGQHTLSSLLQEMRQIFPESTIEESDLTAFLVDLESQQFLQWT
jgi:coenzyme PQQ synthesis protein D (PqqD)